MSAGKPKKVENAKHGWKAKVEIRSRVMDAVGPDRAVVFDAFAGPGLMYREVWAKAAEYVGCDNRWYPDGRCCFVADNCRVLRCVDLSRFTVFDLDAYGSPWEQALIVAARRKLAAGERFGIVLTAGGAKRTQSNALLVAAGLVPSVVRQKTGSAHSEIVDRALRGVVKRMNGRIVKQWRAVSEGQLMTYVGVVVEGVTRPVAPGRRETPFVARVSES